MVRTTNPNHGARVHALMPTYRCEGCGAGVWDTEVQEALKEITRRDSFAAVDECVAGAECPACGLEQPR